MANPFDKVKSDSDVVALAVSDIHLSLNPPIARCKEPNWLAAQSRQLEELHSLAEVHKCPILVAGDVFNRASDSPFFINWAIDHIPKWWYAVPGNHDLLYHSYADLKHTSYYTLVKAGKIINLEPNSPIDLYIKGKWPLRLWGFPCGYSVKPCSDPKDMILEVAVIHSYCWKPEAGYYPGALEEGRVKNLWKKLKGFDVAIFGDNHIPHETQGKTCFLHNCGTFFRRKMTERDGWPSIGLIHADGTVTRHQMDISMDKFIDVDQTQVEAVEGLDDLVRELEEKNIDSAIDFRENLNRVMDDKGISKKIRGIVMGALEFK